MAYLYVITTCKRNDERNACFVEVLPSVLRNHLTTLAPKIKPQINRLLPPPLPCNLLIWWNKQWWEPSTTMWKPPSSVLVPSRNTRETTCAGPTPHIPLRHAPAGNLVVWHEWHLLWPCYCTHRRRRNTRYRFKCIFIYFALMTQDAYEICGDNAITESLFINYLLWYW